ncbi:MAG: hypothetical protein B6U89_07720 [Desulfurococcales archaeon ex4484_58]|nr:MAG: hypothetical protein B6U89_07720 [Desulfurococcales archaeon ex4484_58]
MRNDLKKGLLDVGIIIPEKFGLNVTYSTGKLKVLVGARDPTSGSISESIIEMFVGRVNTLTGLYKVNITLYYIKLGFSNSSYSYVNYTRMNSTGQWYSFYGNKSFIEFLEEYMRGMVVSINASYEDVKPEAFMDRPSILGWYVVGAIGMMFLYSGFTLGATMIVDEKELGTLKRLLATPIKESEFIIAKVLSGITTLVLSALIAILVGVFLVRAKIVFNPLNPIHWLVPLLLFLGAFMTIGLGAMLSLIARSSSGATSLGTALGLFLSFTAGIWLPSYMMPQIFKLLAMYFPVAWIIDTIRCILIFGRYSEALAMMPKIIVSTIIILVIDWFIYKVNLRKYAEE